jgi:hypothetical protein
MKGQYSYNWIARLFSRQEKEELAALIKALAIASRLDSKVEE